MAIQYLATNRKVGDGTTQVWGFSFAGARPDANNGTEPYLDTDDIRVATVEITSEGNEIRDPILFELGPGPSQVTITPAIAAGQDFVIFRETEANLPVSDFTDFTSISEQDLDNSFRQSLFVVQEMRDRTQDSTTTAGEARQVAGEALLVAEAAEDTAEAAVVSAEAADQTANNALLTANTSVDIAEAAEDTANSAVSTANDALDVASSAVGTASSAETLANQALDATDAFTDRVDTIEQVSDQASLDAGEAIQASSVAVQDASESLSLANQAVGTANSAMDLTNTFDGRLDDFAEAVDDLLSGGSVEGLMFKHENLAGLVDTLEARNNLGLGDLATQDLENLDLGSAASRNVGESSGDVMEVGAFGWGDSADSRPELQDADDVSPITAIYSASSSTINSPIDADHTILNIRHSADSGSQLAMRHGTDDQDKLWIRSAPPSKSPWYEVALRHQMEAAIPRGLISMWSGEISTIPSGWALCDGQNGTPDLRDRFTVGAGGEYNVGATGGAKTVALTEAQMPTHNHGVSASSNGAGGHNHTGGTSWQGDHAHSGSTAGAGDHSHNWGFATDAIQVTGRDMFVDLSTDRKRGTSSRSLSLNGTGLLNAGHHAHSFSTNGAGGHRHSFTTSTVGNHAHVINIAQSNKGSGAAHENRPPYYALAYIMKL